MNDPAPPQRRPSADRLPTLTEVLVWPPAATPATASTPPPAVAPPAPTLRMAEDRIIQGVLAQLQRQVDLMLEYRLREVLTPLLARAADAVVRDARNELASALRDVVARAVADELVRLRDD